MSLWVLETMKNEQAAGSGHAEDRAINMDRGQGMNMHLHQTATIQAGLSSDIFALNIQVP